MKNEFKELGTILKRGPRLKDDGSSLNSAVRKAMAEHQRILKIGLARIKRLGGRYPNKLAGKRTIKLDDGTIITTWINPFGLAPTLKASVRLPPGVPSLPSGYPIALDVGLLSFSISPEYPFTVYAGDEVQTYIGGVGTDGEYLLGAASVDGETGCIVWPDSPPNLNGNNAYDSYSWATEESESTIWLALIASEYTGLMRLYIQSKQGAYRDPKEISPDSILWPNTDGIIRSDNYVYWHLRINGAGATATLLANSEKTECIRTGLTAGVFTSSADRKRAESWLLADLTVTDPVSQNEVLTAAQVAAVYANGAGALAHGWSFDRDGTKTAIVTAAQIFNGSSESSPVAGDFYNFSSAQWEVSFDTSDVLPTATITNTISAVSWNIDPGYHTLWVPGAPGFMSTVEAGYHPMTTWEDRFSPYEGNVAPLFCFYDTSGSLQTKSFESTYLTTTEAGSYKEGSEYASGDGSSFTDRTVQIYSPTTTLLGGFTTNMTESSSQYLDAYFQEFIYSGTKSGGGGSPVLAYDKNNVFMSQLETLMQGPCPINGQNNDPSYAAYQEWVQEQFDYNTGITLPFDGYQTYTSATGDFYRKAGELNYRSSVALIPQNDAEAYYSIEQEYRTGAFEEYEIWETDQALAQFRTEIYKDGLSEPTVQYGWQNYGLSWACITGGGSLVESGSGTEDNRYEVTATLSLSAGDHVISQDYDAFKSLIYTGLDVIEDGIPFVISSFSGDAIYSSQTYPGIVTEWESGYPAYSTLSGLARWVGWS